MKIFNNKHIQNFYKNLASPKYEKITNNFLPVVETAACTASYVYATHTNKSIDKERKPMLQMQNIISGLAGMTVSSALNSKVTKLGKKVIEGLDPKHIPNFNKVVNGIKVGLPILVTTLVMRFGMAVAAVPLSDALNKLFNKDKVDKS